MVALSAAVVLLARVGVLAPPPSPDRPPWLGVDQRDYPGAAAMERLRRRYRWTGYYLTAPNHPGDSWMGRWPSLRSLGFGVAVIYVGQQVGDLDAEQARADAEQAIAETAAEGFTDGTAIFLDVEHRDLVDDDYLGYARAWVARVDASRFRPALYCHAANAAALIRRVGIDPARAPLWVAGGGVPGDGGPDHSGVPDATAWQFALDVNDPDTGLRIDQSVSRQPSPSEPFPRAVGFE